MIERVEPQFPPGTVPADALCRTLDCVAYASLYAFVFTIPWAEEISEIGGFVIDRWVGLLALLTAMLRVLAVRTLKKPCALHSWMAAFAIWSGASFIWSANPGNTVTRTTTYLQCLVLVWLIWELTVTEMRVIGLLEAYILGTCVSSASVVWNLLSGRTAAQIAYDQGIITGDINDATRYTAEGFNANDLGLLLALSVPMTLYLISVRKRGCIAYLCWAQLIVCVTAIFLTGSRTAVISLAVALAIVPFAVPRWPKHQKLISALVLSIGVTSAIILVPKGTWERLLTIQTEVTSGTLDLRTVIWKAGLQVFQEHPFLGVGSGAFGQTMGLQLDRAFVAHNTFLSILVELGVVGALIMSGLLLCMLYCAFHFSGLKKQLWTVLLLTWGVGVSAATWEYHKPTWLLFGLLTAQASVVSIEERFKQRQAHFSRFYAQDVQITRYAAS